MKCSCGRYTTQQSRTVARYYQANGDKCLTCLGESLNVPYQDLIDRYNGITDCRECARKKMIEERRRLLNGGVIR